MNIFLTTFFELPVWMLITLGFYISYKVLKFPDLTVDASFLVGTVSAACAAMFLQSSFLGLLFAILFGALAGFITGTIYLTNPRPAYKLLSGLLVIFAYYSLNFRLLGRRVSANFLLEPTLINKIIEAEAGLGSFCIYKPYRLLIGLLFLALVICVLIKFLGSTHGLLLRCIGSRSSLFCSAKKNSVAIYIYIGLIISNVIVSIGGWLYGSINSYAYINIFGTIMHVLASAIIGELIIERLPIGLDNRSSIMAIILAPLVGALVYYFFRSLVAVIMLLESKSIDGDTISIHRQDQNTLLAFFLLLTIYITKKIFSTPYTFLNTDESL